MNLKHFGNYFLFFLLLNLSLFSLDARERDLKVPKGKQTILKTRAIRKIAIGNSSIADVKAIGRTKLLILGKNVGSTSLIIFHSKGKQSLYNITVTPIDPRGIIAEIVKILGNREGIFVHAVGDKVVLDGKALTAEDYRRIIKIKKLYPNSVSFVTIDPDAKRVIARELNKTFQDSGLKNVVANVYGSNIFLEGSVANKHELGRAEKIVKSLGEDVENLLQVGVKQMVLIEVDFVELRRGSTRNLGVTWPLNFTGKTDANIGYRKTLYSSKPLSEPDSVLFSGNTTISSDMNIRALFNNGYARILARPKLVCASGEKAKFLSGGQVPVPIVTQDTAYVEWKDYGIKLDIVPTSDKQGNISVKIMAEVSDIDKSNAVMGIPAFRTSMADTNVSVHHGETIVLSGLFANMEQKDVAKIPGLGHIPIIGELFKSRSWNEKKSELSIFVTPRLVTPFSKRIRQNISSIRKGYKESGQQVGFSIFD